jgi:hypothetical protein
MWNLDLRKKEYEHEDYLRIEISEREKKKLGE